MASSPPSSSICPQTTAGEGCVRTVGMTVLSRLSAVGLLCVCISAALVTRGPHSFSLTPLPTFLLLLFLLSVSVFRAPRTMHGAKWAFCNVDIHFLSPFVEKTTLSPLNNFGTLVQNNLTVHTRLYFSVLYASLLINVFMPVPP